MVKIFLEDGTFVIVAELPLMRTKTLAPFQVFGKEIELFLIVVIVACVIYISV